MYINEYEILIASPFDREYLVVEVYHNLLFAEINQEQDFLEIEIYPTSDNKISIKLKSFIEVIDIAKRHLQAKHVHVVPMDSITLKRKNNDIYLYLNKNEEIAAISNNVLELRIQKGNSLKLPLEKFLEALRSCVTS